MKLFVCGCIIDSLFHWFLGTPRRRRLFFWALIRLCPVQYNSTCATSCSKWILFALPCQGAEARAASPRICCACLWRRPNPETLGASETWKRFCGSREAAARGTNPADRRRCCLTQQLPRPLQRRVVGTPSRDTYPGQSLSKPAKLGTTACVPQVVFFSSKRLDAFRVLGVPVLQPPARGAAQWWHGGEGAAAAVPHPFGATTSPLQAVSVPYLLSALCPRVDGDVLWAVLGERACVPRSPERCWGEHAWPEAVRERWVRTGGVGPRCGTGCCAGLRGGAAAARPLLGRSGASLGWAREG